LEESGHALIEVLSQHLLGGAEENIRIPGVLAKIQIEHLPNTSIKVL
jgi:hypothetical protein